MQTKKAAVSKKAAGTAHKNRADTRKRSKQHGIFPVRKQSVKRIAPGGNGPVANLKILGKFKRTPEEPFFNPPNQIFKQKVVSDFQEILAQNKIPIQDDPLKNRLSYLFTKIDDLTKNFNEWRIEENDDAVIVVGSSVCEASYEVYWLEIKNLPILRETSGAVHDLVVDCLSLIMSKCGISFGNIDEMLIEWIEENLAEFDEDEDIESGYDVGSALEAIEFYREGLPVEYGQLLSPNRDIDNFKENVAAFMPQTPIEKEIKAWLEIGIELISSPYKIDDFFDEDSDENPTPDAYIQLIWDYEDFLGRQRREWMQSYYETNGKVEPLTFKGVFSKWRPGDISCPEWPNKLLRFFEDGTAIMEQIGEGEPDGTDNKQKEI